jgi:hypothetical protein
LKSSPYYGGKIMLSINAIPIHKGDKDIPGPTFAILYLTGYTSDSNGGILLSPELATEKEVDEAVEHLVTEIQKAAKAAKRILSKGGKK